MAGSATEEAKPGRGDGGHGGLSRKGLTEKVIFEQKQQRGMGGGLPDPGATVPGRRNVGTRFLGLRHNQEPSVSRAE